MGDYLVVAPGSPVFIIMCVICILFLFVVRGLLKEQSEKIRRRFVIGFYIFGLILFAIYKYEISLDVEYHILSGDGTFTFWNELPLHPCNIVLLMTPIAVYSKKRPLLAYCYFCSMLGPLMALLMPGIGFDGYSILLPRVLGYYVTHFMALLAGPLLMVLDLYLPKLRDIPITCLLLTAVAFCVEQINLWMRCSGMNPAANYFFTIDTEQNAILELFYSWIPHRMIYLLPGFLIILPVFLITASFGEIKIRLRKDV